MLADDRQRQMMPSARRATPERVLAILIVLVSVSALAYRVWTAAPGVSDRADEMRAAYASLAARLPDTTRVGFVTTSPGQPPTSEAWFLAQNALAPRLLGTNLDEVAVVISMPSAPASLDADPRLAAFELMTTGDKGIRVYHRRTP
jgi:hypothetical protein